MNAKQIKIEADKLAAETGCTFIEACQAMQAAAAKLKNEKVIEAIHKIKMAAIEAQF